MSDARAYSWHCTRCGACGCVSIADPIGLASTIVLERHEATARPGCSGTIIITPSYTPRRRRFRSYCIRCGWMGVIEADSTSSASRDARIDHRVEATPCPADPLVAEICEDGTIIPESVTTSPVLAIEYSAKSSPPTP